MANTSLVDYTRKLLLKRERTLTYDEIALKVGLSKHFIGRFARGKEKCASADRVQALYEFLTDEPLIKTALNDGP